MKESANMITVTFEDIQANLSQLTSSETDINQVNEAIVAIMPSIIRKVDPNHLYSTEENTVATLKLGAIQVITGHVLQKLAEREEDTEKTKVGPIDLSPSDAAKDRMKRAKSWIEQGWMTLEDFLIRKDCFFFGVVGYER